LEDTMITSDVRAAVSVVTLAFASLTLGACSRNAPPDTRNGTVTTPEGRFTIRFENEAQTYVDVYLVGDRREWRLGRVEPGARVILRLPEQALAASPGFVQLAVLVNAPFTVQAAHDPRAIITIAQPLSDLLSQQWAFWPKPLTEPQVIGTRTRR
jgi:hypothetical protein